MNNNISKYSLIKYIKLDDFKQVNNTKELKLLKQKVKYVLRERKGFIQNKNTNYIAKINNKSIGKILFPAPFFNPYKKNYINNLNASLKLKELFENAIYVDTLKPMKAKVNNPNEIGYHHFVAPLIMNNRRYRVLITAKEKINSKILYIISSEVNDLKLSYIQDLLLKKISVKRLVKNIKIYNYDLEDYNSYDVSKININNHLIKETTLDYCGY